MRTRALTYLGIIASQLQDAPRVGPSVTLEPSLNLNPEVQMKSVADHPGQGPQLLSVDRIFVGPCHQEQLDHLRVFQGFGIKGLKLFGIWGSGFGLRALGLRL